MPITAIHHAFDLPEPEFFEPGAIGLELSGQLINVVRFLIYVQILYLDRILDNYRPSFGSD